MHDGVDKPLDLRADGSGSDALFKMLTAQFFGQVLPARGVESSDGSVEESIQVMYLALNCGLPLMSVNSPMAAPLTKELVDRLRVVQIGPPGIPYLRRCPSP